MTALGKWRTIVVSLLALSTVAAVVALASLPLLRSSPVRAAFTAPPSVTVSPDTAGDPARYTIVATSDQPHPAGSSYFITFPAGTTLPSAISRVFVRVNGVVAREVGVDVAARRVTVVSDVEVAANSPTTIEIEAGAGVTNPVVPGTYTLSLASTLEPATTTASYTIRAKLAASPTSGARGTTVTVSGVGWAPGTSVEVRRTDSTGPLLGTGTVGADRRFSVSVTASVPPFTAGPNTLFVRDGAGTSATITFSVSPSLGTPSPTAQRHGGTVSIPLFDVPTAGAGTATIRVGGALATTTPVDAAPSQTLTFTVPTDAPVGDVEVAVTMVDGTTVRTTLRVLGADVTLTPTSGPNRTNVTIRATGLTPGGVIAPGGIKFAGVDWNLAPTTVDSAGVAVVTLPLSTVATPGVAAAIPFAGTPGTYQVVVSDGIRSGVATFTIPSRSITVSPTESGRGSTITVRGTGFSANSIVTFTYAGATVPGVTATTDATGAFAASFAVPATAGIPSSNPIVATDEANLTASATHRVPAASLTVTPAEAAPGATVRLVGTGFPAFASVTSIAVGTAVVTPVPTPVTDVTGRFEATITVPALAPGAYVIRAEAGGTPATITFTLTERPPRMEDIVAPIRAQLVRIWGFDAATQRWQVFDPAAPALSDLTALVRGQGYWVFVNADVTWTHAGNVYHLRRGWNLIGWLGP